MAETMWQKYRRTAIAEMADWHPGFDMSGVSVSEADREAGSPKEGDKIARNPANHADKWLVAADYFAANFAPLSAPGERLTRSGWTCPYDRDLCGADATLTVTQIDSDQVEGLLECVNGHRWKLARLADLSEEG